MDRLRIDRRRWLIGSASIPWLTCATTAAEGLQQRQHAARRGRDFLANLFDPELHLLPEYAGASVFWLYHDNYLAAKVLCSSHPLLAQQIQEAMKRFDVRASGKIELLFDEVPQPLPFRHPKLIDVQRIGERTVKTEIVTEVEFREWQQYADLLLMASIALSRSDRSEARQLLHQSLQMWDGRGFHDRAMDHMDRYATYKLALAVLAAHRCQQAAELPAAVLQQLLELQTDTGGWVTDYDAAGGPVGKANVETTCLAILAVET